MQIEKISALKKIHHINNVNSVQSNLQNSTNKIAHVEHNVQHLNINKAEFFHLMKNRPLIKYRYARNSFIKRGDKKILAEGLGISVEDVENFISEIDSFA